MCILTISDLTTLNIKKPLDISSYLVRVQQETKKAKIIIKLIKEKQKKNDEPPVDNNTVDEPVFNINILNNEQQEEPFNNTVDNNTVDEPVFNINILNDEQQEEPFNNCIMDNIKKLHFDVIKKIINYVPGATIKPVYDTLYSEHYDPVQIYKGLIIKDLYLECLKENNDTYEFKVIDPTMPKLINENKQLIKNVKEIIEGSPHYKMIINNITPNIKLNKVFLCNIIFKENYDYSHIGTITRAVGVENEEPIININDEELIKKVLQDPKESDIERYRKIEYLKKYKLNESNKPFKKRLITDYKNRAIKFEQAWREIKNMYDDEGRPREEEPQLNNNNSTDTERDAKILKKYNADILKGWVIDAEHVNKKKRIIKEYKDDKITFDEALNKLKKISEEEAKNDSIELLKCKIRRYFNISRGKQDKGNIINKNRRVGDKIQDIIKEYKDDKITFGEADEKLKTLSEKTEQQQEELFNNTVDEPVSNNINLDDKPQEEQQQEEPFNNTVNEPVFNIINSDDEPQEEQPNNNNNSIDKTHNAKRLKKCKVERDNVHDKNKIIKDYKDDKIKFDEALNKIKKIQREEIKKENIRFLRRGIITKFNFFTAATKKEIENIINKNRSEYDELKRIIKEYTDDKITFEKAKEKVETLRDRKTEQPTEEPFNNTVDETIVKLKSSDKTTSKILEIVEHAKKKAERLEEKVKTRPDITLNNYWKIKLNKNDKTPRNKWQDKNNHFKAIDNNKYNVGVLTGKINNLVVVDVDVKKENKKEKDGMEKIEQFIKDNGIIDTFTVKSVNGGYHFYFKLDSNNQDIKYIIDNVFYTRTNLGGYTIDIRCNNAYIVAPPSFINNKTYEIINNASVNELPLIFGNFLKELHDEPYKDKIDKLNKRIIKETDIKQDDDNNDETDDNLNDLKHEHTEHLINKFKFVMSDDDIINLLDRLPTGYDNNFFNYMKITTILKSHNKFNIWNNWSKKNKEKYNYNKNLKLWNYCKPLYNINLLVHILRSETGAEIPYITYYKIYTPITNNNFYDNTKTENNERVSNIWNYEDFLNNDIHIIKSTTGTGKTTATAQHVEKYIKENPNIKFLTLTARQTLSQQHKQNFKNINLISYQDTVADLTKKKAVTVCINSLERLGNLDEEDISNYILYIDEVSSFLDFTHNTTLKTKMKHVYYILRRLIKYSHKVIISDRLINDSCINFLKCRTDDTKTIYINNTFKKYQNKPAIRMRNENKFIERIYEDIDNKKFFWFGSDSNSIVTKLYNKCLLKYPDIKDNFVLITADTDIRINRASEQFLNKFVFYSPKITYGIDFTINEAQNVYIYIKGRTLDPAALFQQATRTRNMNALYFFCECSNNKEKYKDENELNEELKNNIINNELLNDVCLTLDEDVEYKLVENSFFKSYVYNEYVKDIYSTSKLEHFKNILLDEGFIISSMHEPKHLEKDSQDELSQIMENITNEHFNEYIKAEHKCDEKYEQLNKRISILNLDRFNNDILINYKDIITDKYKFNEHLNIIRLLKTDEYLNDKYTRLRGESLKTNLLKYDEYKMVLIRTFEKYYNLCPLDVEGLDKLEEFKQVEAQLFNNIVFSFETKKTNPTNINELKQIYVLMIKHLTNKDIISSKQIRQGGTRIYNYFVDDKFIKYHIELNEFSNKYHKRYHEHFINKYELITKKHDETVKNDNIDDICYFLD